MVEYTVNGETYKVRKPNSIQKNQGRRIYNQAFNQALTDGCMIKEQAINFSKERGIWNTEKEAELAELRKKIDDGEKILELGGIELSQAKDVALDIRQNRFELMLRNIALSEIFANTAEREAEFAESQYIMSVCICQKNGQPLCKDLNDFLNRQDEPPIVEGINKFNDLMYGNNADYFKELPENKFLIEYGFMDNEMNLLDENGQKIVNEDEKVERKPFLKNGEPIVKDQPVSVEPEPALVG